MKHTIEELIEYMQMRMDGDVDTDIEIIDID